MTCQPAPICCVQDDLVAAIDASSPRHGREGGVHCSLNGASKGGASFAFRIVGLLDEQHSFLNRCVFVNMSQHLMSLRIWETQDRRGTQIHSEKCSNCVVSSHLDPIGDQTDVQ